MRAIVSLRNLLVLATLAACDEAPPAGASGDEPATEAAPAPARARSTNRDVGVAMREDYASSLAGRKVAFVPIAMGFDLTEGWAAVLKKEAHDHGFELTIKDPNWSTDALRQAMDAAIAEEPDLIIAHNTNLQLLAKSLKKAEEKGIRVVQLNMPSAYRTDAYIGTDWIELGEVTGRKLIEECGVDNGGSGKVAVIQGQITDAASVYQLKGLDNAMKAAPGQIEIVTNQAAEWDATKAKAVAETIAQQYPDLCGVYGFWDVMMKGAGEALKEASASRDEPIKVFTSGGGTTLDCDGVRDGVYSYVWAYMVPGQARDIGNVVKQLLQSDSKPSEHQFSLFTPLTEISRDTLRPGLCWDLEALKAETATQ